MKKIIALALAALMTVFALAGCATDKGDGAASASDSMTLSEIMATLLDDAGELPMLGEIALDNDNFEYYAFVAPIDGAEGLASEAMIGSIAHSVVLIRLPEGADAAAVAADIEANANPAKWICVEAEKTVVDYSGRLVLLVMSFTDTADAIEANFTELYK